MKLSRNWLNEFVDIMDIDSGELANRITMTTAEIEGWWPWGGGLSGVVAGRILEVESMPQSDQLTVVQVDVAGKAYEMVCGAPNVARGLVVPVALPGSTLPDGTRIEATRIRGVASAGVLCSARELGLGEDHTGLMSLDADMESGCALPELFPVEDIVFEIENKSLTHRPDLWGHYGIAREIAGLLGRELRPLDVAEAPSAAGAVPVRVEDVDLCPRYIAQVLRGLRIGPSPAWMQTRLASVGVRPISNIVDFTNYVMLEIGQPMHAFDRARIGGQEIRVRTARAGESIRTLDGTDRALDPRTLVIADRDRPVAIAGIMGGVESEISDATEEMVLESANFDPVCIRRSASRLGLRTEAAARFEKSLDPKIAREGVLRFLRLCELHAKGSEAVGGLEDAYRGAPEATVITIGLEKIRKRLGVPISMAHARDSLERIAFETSVEGDSMVVAVPSFRATKDVTIEEDLIEEIGRMYGYDNIEEAPLRIVCQPPPRDPMRELEWALRDRLSLGFGFHEISLHSFVSDEAVAAFGREGEAYRHLANPIASNLGRLRTSLAPNILMTLPSNLRSHHEVRVFELGRVHLPGAEAPAREPVERRDVCILYCRRVAGKTSKRDESDAAFRSVQGVLEGLLRGLGVDDWTLKAGNPEQSTWAHPTRSAQVLQGKIDLGRIVQLHPAALKTLKVQAEGALVILHLGALLDSERTRTRHRPLPKFPAVFQDLSVIVDEAVTVGEVTRSIRETGGALVSNVRLFDVWRGKPVDAGKKSLTFEIVYLSHERTLRDDEVAEVHGRICSGLAEKGGTVRGL